MKQPFYLLGLCSVIALVPAVHAQVTGVMQQADPEQQRHRMAGQSYAEGDSAPELYPAESSDVGPQSVLKSRPRKTLFEATADAQYFYTDNMFLTEHFKHKADVLVSTAQIALAPTPYDLWGGSFAPRIGYRHQWFDFGLARNGDALTIFDAKTHTFRIFSPRDFDFNAQTMFMDGSWTRDNWIFDAGVDYTRLMTTGPYQEFYHEFVPRWGAQRLFPLNDNMVFSLGYAGDYRFTSAQTFFPTDANEFADRTDQILYAAYTQTLCRYAILGPYYQLKYTHFTKSPVGSRNDLLNSFGLALYCPICPNFEVRTFVEYNMRSSDNSAVPEYRQLDGGSGVNVTFLF